MRVPPVMVRFRGLIALAIAGLLCAQSELGNDYAADAGPGIDAMLDGDVDGALSSQPLMGSFSLLLRVPFAGIARLSGGGELAEYRVGAFGCLLVSIGLLTWVSSVAARRGAPSWAVFALPLAGTLNGPIMGALFYGHPEEVMAAAMVLAATVAVATGSVPAGALLLGLAIATKQWALVALLPLIALTPPGRRLAATAQVVAIPALFALPYLLGDPATFVHTTRAMADVAGAVWPRSIWLPVAYQDPHAIVDHAGSIAIYGETWSVGSWVSAVSHPLILAVSAPIAWAFARAHRGRTPDVSTACALIALVLLLRCVLDPWNNGYYHLPMLFAVLGMDVWGSIRGRRPWASVWAFGGMAAIAGGAHLRLMPIDDPFIAENLFYLAWALVLVAALGRRALRPAAAPAVSGRRSHRAEPSTPADPVPVAVPV